MVEELLQDFVAYGAYCKLIEEADFVYIYNSLATLLTVELSDATLNAPRVISAQGKGPLEALANALASLGVNVQVLNYSQHSLSKGAHSRAVTYIECEVNGVPYWGVGIDQSITTASFKAVISAVNRALRASRVESGKL